MSIRGGKLPPASYRERSYRSGAGQTAPFSFELKVGESDLWISGIDPQRRELARERLLFYRAQIESLLLRRPDWGDSLIPLKESDYQPLPRLPKAMMAASAVAGVGPMAAVAGALAEAVGRDLMLPGNRVVVENGGDIFLAGDHEYRLALFAGESPLSGKVGIRLSRETDFACGVGTSSATVGHSLSFGRADAFTVVADNAALADAAATAGANRLSHRRELAAVIREVLAWPGVWGSVAVLGEDLAAGGELELIEI